MKISRILFLLAAACFVAGVAQAERLHPEKWYQEKWCERRGGQVEVALQDRTRCDCITAEYAVEVEFANKWKEALGQALHYSLLTSRKAGIVLILEAESDWRYYYMLMSILVDNGLKVRVWTMMER